MDKYENLLQNDNTYIKDSYNTQFINLFEINALIVWDFNGVRFTEKITPTEYFKLFKNDNSLGYSKIIIDQIYDPVLINNKSFELECSVKKVHSVNYTYDTISLMFRLIYFINDSFTNIKIRSIDIEKQYSKDTKQPLSGYFVISKTMLFTFKEALYEMEYNSHLKTAKIREIDPNHFVIVEEYLHQKIIKSADLRRIIRQYKNNYRLDVIIINSKYL